MTWLTLLFALWAAGFAVAADEPDPTRDGVQVVVRGVGDGVVREGAPATLWVRLENRGLAPNRASIDLVEYTGRDPEPVSFTRTVELPVGARKEVHLTYRPGPNGDARTVRVSTRLGAVERTTAVRFAAPDDVTVGVFGTDALGTTALGRLTPGGVPGRAPRDRVWGSDRGALAGLIEPGTEPDRSAGYAAFDWLVWRDPDPRALSASQQDAVLGFVADGGHLLVFATESWSRIAGTPLGDALPVELTGLELTDMSPIARAIALPEVGSEAPAARSRLRADAPGRRNVALARVDDDHVLWSAGTFGLGTVHVVAVDPRGDGLGPVRRPALMRRLLHLAEVGASLEAPGGVDPAGWEALVAAMDANDANGDPGAGLDRQLEWEDQIRGSLADIPGVEPMPVRWLAAFALVYLIVVGPFDFVVLRLLRRQPATWFTFPVYVVAFSAAALVFTARLKGDQAVLVRYEVVDVLPGAERWRGESYVGVFATSRSQLRVVSGYDDAIVEPLMVPGSMWQPEVRSSEGPLALSYRAETWTLAYARSAWVAPASGGIAAEWRDGRLALISTLPFDLHDVRLHDGTGVRLYEVLGAGATALPTPSSGNEPYPAEHLLLQDYPERGRGHLTTEPGHAVLVGSTTEAFEPLLVGGITPEIRSHTVVRTPVNLPERP